MSEVLISPPDADDCIAFLDAVAQSRELHASWVEPPSTPESFREFLERLTREDNAGYLIRLRDSAAIVGMANLSNIVRGNFCSCYLGFYALAPLAGRGLMRQGLRLVIDDALGRLELHRIEANIQPDNHRSIALVQSLGFRREGFSPRYLRIGGVWRDHERWALTIEDLAAS